ncbi:MAG: 23S rRNA (guanosine(2251)-2'-O)-methyltransferase RlmB [Brevinematales bacterium]|nr:23S rRNA (guanosine(2251)-2'-O)-methyltransferase RlmB [Brevinematales bacterium]
MNEPGQNNYQRCSYSSLVNNTMIFFGINSTIEALNSKHSRNIKEIIVEDVKRSPRIQRIIEISSRLGIKIRSVNKNVLKNIAKTSSHQGIAFDLRNFQYTDIEEAIKKRNNIVLCDSITDPNNLGSIMRNAILFGFNTIVITKDRSIDITPTVAKVSSGALFHLDIVKIVNLGRTIELLKEEGYYIIGLDVNGQKEISELVTKGLVGLVLGAEGKGLRELIKKKCNALCRIETTNKIDSLNVAVASGIAMYELFKRTTI